MTYTIIEDSHFRRFLKEEGYGFIARVYPYTTPGKKSGAKIMPMNKGVDMSADELEAAFNSTR
jgi:hypothetical protein